MILNFDIKDFLNYLTAEKGSSKNTVQAYRRDLSRFEQFLLSKAVADIAKVNFSLFYDFLKSMCEEELSPATRRRHLGCLKTYFRFLKREGIIKHNFVKYIEAPKLWHELPEILTVQEMFLFLDTPHQDTRSTSMRLRNRAICELLYGSGIRISELIEIKVGDIGEGFIKITGKGGKERVVPITKHSEFAIQTYWKEKRNTCVLNSNDYVFTSRTGKKIDRVESYKMIQRHVEFCGITKKISPHSFRHSFATHLLDNGCDLAVLKDMLGHSCVSTTGRYLHLSTANLSEKFIKLHPRYFDTDSQDSAFVFSA